MDREIKFRGFHKDPTGATTVIVNGKEYVGNWIYGYYHKEVSTSLFLQEYGVNEMETHYIHTVINHLPFRLQVIPETVGQYIELKDKNGKEIYEADTVKGIHYKEVQGVVYFLNGSYSIKNNKHICTFSGLTHHEVIGTIFDKEIQ